jgi:hypothetical protein
VQVFCFVLLVLFCVGFQITKERCSQWWRCLVSGYSTLWIFLVYMFRFAFACLVLVTK